jgi:hypothetical protein
MRALLRPLLLPLLRRDPHEIQRRSASFRIESDRGRELVRTLGRSFLEGYNAMLATGSTDSVREQGSRVAAHYRPFFFEGAAMGYLARCLVADDCRPDRAEADLLGMEPGFRYLYYVGLGFWYGFRHPRHPAWLWQLADHVDPMYLPLCFDGFGFKLAFFDFPGRPETTRILERCPPAQRRFIYQGFGRALHFVTMDAPVEFEGIRRELPDAFRADVEFGRSLARGFTGIDRASELLPWVEEGADDDSRATRLTGVTWALTAREMNDPDYFATCVRELPDAERALLTRLPRLCLEQLEGAADYADWQARTREAARAEWKRGQICSPAPAGR